MTRPNIVFIMSDDHAAHAISAYGSRVNSTPHLDRLAREGVRCDAAFCTNSICSPSRASILTGTYSHVNGVTSIISRFDHATRTFPAALREAGYRTAMFGKWHLGESGTALPQDFDAWQIFPGQGEYHDPEMITAEGTATVPGYATDIVTDLALDWIDAQGEDPFCALVHHKAPHRPWQPHEKHRDLYPVGTIPEPPTLLDDYATRSRAVRAATMTLADDLDIAVDIKEPVPEHLRGEEARKDRIRWVYQRYLRDYLQCIQSIDDNVGRLLDHLEQRGLAENTIVVYTSDQGFFLGDHGWYDKRFMYDQSLKMPLLIRWPAQLRPGTELGAILTNVDFAATLLEACGLAPSAALPRQQGRSFLHLLRGEEDLSWPESMYYRYWEHDSEPHHVWSHYGVRTRCHKLVYFYNAGLGTDAAADTSYPPEWELYDLETDPEELVNLADSPDHAGIRGELEAELARLQARYGDAPYVA